MAGGAGRRGRPGGRVRLGDGHSGGRDCRDRRRDGAGPDPVVPALSLRSLLNSIAPFIGLAGTRVTAGSLPVIVSANRRLVTPHGHVRLNRAIGAGRAC